MRAAQFVEADTHGAVVEPRLARHAQAQVNCLELELPLGAVPLERGKDVRVQNVSFLLQVAEGRADKHADDGSEAGTHDYTAHSSNGKSYYRAARVDVRDTTKQSLLLPNVALCKSLKVEFTKA